MGYRNGKWKMLNENESGNKVRFTLGRTRGSVCSDVHAYNLHVIKINLRYGTSERGGQKGKRPRGSRQGRPGMGWAAVPSSV